MPTIPFTDDGQTTEPLVSVPTATRQRFAATATADPELEPQGLRSNANGFFVNPPLPLHPLMESLERMLAHSLRFVLPSRTTPASRKRCTRKASFGALAPTNASDPAVVAIRSAVSILSLINTGMPWRRPRTPFSFRS